MLAGLWGFQVHKARQLAFHLFKRFANPNMYEWHRVNMNNNQADQIFLRDYFTDIVRHSVVIHDSFHCARLGGQPFPTQRPTSHYCHVGAYGCCNLNASFPHECPIQCRKQKEWVFC